MVIKIPTSIRNRFSQAQIDAGLRRADAIVRNRPVSGIGGKAVFDALKSVSPEFKRQILKGQLSQAQFPELARLGLGGGGRELVTFQQQREQQRQQEQFQREVEVSKIQGPVGQPFITQAEANRGVRGIVVTKSEIPTGSIKEKIKDFDRDKPRQPKFMTASDILKTPVSLRADIPKDEVFREKLRGAIKSLEKKENKWRFSLTQSRVSGSSRPAFIFTPPKTELKRFGLSSALFTLGFLDRAVNLILTGTQLRSIFREARRNPIRTIKDIPKNLFEGVEGRVAFFQISPEFAVGQTFGDWYLFKSTNAGLKAVGKISGSTITKLSPKFKAIKGGGIKINIGGKAVDIKLAGRLGSKTLPRESLAVQLQLIGRRVTGVSAQADSLVNLIKKTKIIRKPIPNEARLSPFIKKMLKRFDDGKITSKQLIQLERRIKAQTGQSLLERSFFADPRRRFRPSRLGLREREGTLFDLLSGKATLKKPKPQILVFKDVLVEKFPNTKIFKDITKKLKSGKTLTRKEAEALLKFQLKPSGKFKPLGKLSKEPEITASPSDIVKKVKTIGVTLINGKRVKIVQAEIVKASKSTKNLLKKARAGKLSTKELKRLNKKLIKESKGISSVSSRRAFKKFFPLKRKTISALVSRLKPIKRTPRQIRNLRLKSLRKARKVRASNLRKGIVRPTKKPSRIIPPRVLRPPKRPPRLIPPRVLRPPKRPFKRLPILPITKKAKKIRKLKKKKKKVQAFDVFVRPIKRKGAKKRPKLKKVNVRPLTKTQARNLGATIVDKTIARTFKIRVASGKPKRASSKIKSFSKPMKKKKFRDFRIVKGKKKPLKNTFVERKGKFLIDTAGEKRGLRASKVIKQLRSRPKLISPTRKSPVQINNDRLRNLKKARQVKANNLGSRTSTRTKKKSSGGKRKVSAKQLRNLARGREIRMANLRRR